MESPDVKHDTFSIGWGSFNKELTLFCALRFAEVHRNATRHRE
jgi:hypothetical protein